jgi:DNA replicative helicase MCM subunit Mcm2 (Cdc46/Mcm family)
MAVDYDVARERITDFLQTYYVEDDEEMKTFTYADQMMKIMRRQQVAFYIMLDDIHTHDPELCEWIQENTYRFRQLFYEAIDKCVDELRGDDEVRID